MKYFTLDDWIADQDLDHHSTPSYEAVTAYKQYFNSIVDILPSDFLKMLRTVYLHDANLRELEIDILRHHVTIRLDAGDLTMRENLSVMLSYDGVIQVWSGSDPNKGLPGPHGYGDLGNDEIEVLEGGGYEHRMLFSSGIELGIRFRDFGFEILQGQDSAPETAV